MGATGSENPRLQTSYGRHNNKANIVYVDGHASPSLPSNLTWGQFYGVFDGQLKASPSTANQTLNAGDPISSKALDGQVWASSPE